MLDASVIGQPVGIPAGAGPAADAGLATPTWRSLPALPAPPRGAQAQPANAVTPNAVSTCGIDPAAQPELIELTRALRNDPDLIYQYVHDNIEFTPIGGTLKGPLGTMADGRGTAYDQAALMVTLLQLASASNPAITNVRYELGQITLNLAQLQNWLGVDDRFYSIGYLFGSGGINALISTSDGTVNGTVTGATLDHIWVRVNISGTDFVFDPAFKTYTRTNPIGLAAAMGYSRSTFLADALTGVTRTSSSIQGVNRTNVRNDLATFATNLASFIRTNAPSASVMDIVGGRAIVPTTGTLRQTNLPYASGSHTNSTTIPSTFHPTLAITLPGAAAVTCNADDLYGHRMTIFFDTSNRPVLRIDGTVMSTGSPGSPGTNMSIGTVINVPFFSGAGRSTSLNITVGGSFLIGDGWDQVGRGTIEKHRAALHQALAAGGSATSEPVLGESLAVAGYTWLAEVAAQQQLTDQLLTTTSLYFYGIGIVGIITSGSTTSPFVDLPLNFTNTPTRVNGVASGAPPNGLAAFFDGSGASSGFESGVLEQTQAQIPNFVAASTTRLLDTASQADTIFDINDPAVAGDNAAFYFSTIRPQLAPNYDAGSLATIDSYVNANFRVIAPLHGRLAVGRWTGVGFKTISPDGHSMGEIISGGLSGGFGGVNDPPGTFVLSTDGTLIFVPGSPDPFANGFFPFPFPPWGNGVGDPVDRITGSYLYHHDDLTIGSAGFPYGLGFQRSYSSGAQSVSGAIGSGWTHNFAMSANVDSDGFNGMGRASPISASSAIAALFVSSDLLNGFIDPPPAGSNLDLFVVESQVNRWFIDQLTGNVVNVSLPSGTEQFVRLADGTTYSAPLGSSTVLSRAPDGTFRYATKDGITLSFNTNGTVSTWANAAGMTVSFTYSGGVLTSVQNSLGRQLSFTYSGGLITSVADGTGRSVGYTYTGNRLTSFRDALNQTTTFAYDTTGAFDLKGHLTQIFYPANPANAFVTNFYDQLGRVSQQRDANGNVTLAFIAGTRSEIVDPAGTRHVWQMDARGAPIRRVDDLGDTSHLNVTTTFAYDGQQRLALTTLPEGNTDVIAYDSSSNPLTVTRNPKSGSGLPALIQSFTYVKPVAAFPNLTLTRTYTDARGNVTTYGYDSATGNLLTLDQPPVNGQTPRQSFTYDGIGQVLTTTDPAGKVTRYTYDASGNRRSTSDDFGGLNLLTSLDYDAVGNVVTKTDGRGNATTMLYDAERRLTKVTAPAPLSFVTDYVYDANGQALQTRRSTDTPNAPQVSSVTYTLTGKQRTTTDASNNVTTFAYDSLDRLASKTDPEGRVTTFTYDALSRSFQIFNTAIQAAPLEQNAYTPNGKLQSVTNARGNATTYQYDGHDRLSRTTFPDTTNESLSYDASNNILSRTTRAGQSITFSYDALNRVTTKGPTGEPTVSYAYDIVGRVLSVSHPGAVFGYGYDTAGRNTSATRPDGKQVSYQYDAASNKSRVAWPDTYFVTYAFDAVNRMTDVRENGTRSLASFTYDALSRRKTLTYGNGANVTYGYSANDDLTNETQQFSTVSSTSFTYTFNKAHQTTGKTVSDGTFMFRPTVSSTTAYTSNPVDEYTSVGGVGFTYDGNGNLLRDGVNTYTYDAENHLLTAAVPGHAINYGYDPLGRRLTKTVDGVVTNYLSDGSREIAEYDGAGALLRRYVYGPGLDEPLVTVSSSGARSYNHQDGLGSVIALTDDGGSVTDRYSYGAFGETSSTAGNAFRFVGRRLDAETGLYYYRARYYSPALGRFLQTDPIGYAGGLNLYAYVVNDPLNRTDPTGLWFGIDDAIFVIGGGLIGAAGQLISDGIFNHRLSTGRDLAASFVGGAVTAEVALYAVPTLGPLGLVVAGAAGGAATNLTGYGIDKFNNPNTEFSVGRFAWDTTVGGLTGFIPGFGIEGVTLGRNSYSAIFKQMTTKAMNGTIENVTLQTAIKMFMGEAMKGAFLQGAITSGSAGDLYEYLFGEHGVLMGK